jgi:phosphopantothenate-cysteine ligase
MDPSFTAYYVAELPLQSSIRNFLERQRRFQRNLAVVSSGGTTVPLEKHTVRFLDNFSTGRRGAASAEYFLESEYAVVFLYRAGSLRPLQRRLAKLVTDPVTALVSEGHIKEGVASFRVTADAQAALVQYERALKEERVLEVPFCTVYEYAQYLELIASASAVFERNAILYMAAAVSDFYLRFEDFKSHKRTSDSALVLKLSCTPKLLDLLRELWAPQAFVVAFKLETSMETLHERAQLTASRSGAHIMVANLLHERHHRVWILENGRMEEIECPESDTEIEKRIVEAVIASHRRYLDADR